MKKTANKFSVKTIISVVAALMLMLAFTFALMPVNSAQAGLTSKFYLESASFNGALSKGTFDY